jgi:D-alanyl-D-alanine carboxypeptidase
MQVSETVPSSIFKASPSRTSRYLVKVCLGLALTISAVAAATPSEAATYAGIVVDAKTGNVLYSQDADSLHYPASLTKMMTLYLTFEALEAGKISLDTPVPFSRNAAAQPPTKLSIRVGSTVTVQQAVLSMITLSANDAAMALGEFVGGSEENFARMMNDKARALGMTRTTYRNPNGLPNTAQMTTARDQARLSVALREHFPQYYGFFSTTSFQLGSRTIHGHNHLLGTVRGVDGIKTGYTRAAGFNLATSVQLDGRSIVGVVLGGASTPARDNQMRRLVATYLPQASVHADTGKLVAQVAPERPAFQASAPLKPNVEAAAARMAALSDVRPPSSVPMPDVRYQPSSAAAFAAVTPKSANPLAATKPHNKNVPPNEVASIAPAYAESNDDTQEVDSVVTASTKPAQSDALQDKGPSGWVIQVGVSPSKEMASDLLDNAKSKASAALRAAKPYTVAFGSGSSQVYRARFGGFDNQREATNACSVLKRSGIKCWASLQ